MIAGISGIGAPGIITNITSASLGGITGVGRVVKQPDDDNSLKNQGLSQNPSDIFEQNSQSANPENVPGTAYGLPANQLRTRGMFNQLENQPANDASPAEKKSVEVSSNSSKINEQNSEVTEEDSEVSADEPGVTEERKPNGETLDDGEKKQVKELQARDTEVRTHEQAHIAASGGYAQGAPQYDYQQGPDGEEYAIGGSVKIDTSVESTPEATIAKMQKVRAAAMAPAEPSSQDRAVAAEAAQKMQQAQQELAQEKETTPDRDTEAQAGGTLAADTVSNENAKQNSNHNEGLPEIPTEESAAATETSKAVSSAVATAKLSYQQQRARIAYHAA